MKRINLYDYYPLYLSDFYIEVTDNVAHLLKQLKRNEHADYERRRVHGAYYSLDAGDGIEKNIVFMALSPEEIYEQKLTNKNLYAAINCLPEKQAKRIYAYFFFGLSKTQIAQIEGVNRSQISRSIERALKNMEIFLEKAQQMIKKSADY